MEVGAAVALSVVAVVGVAVVVAGTAEVGAAVDAMAAAGREGDAPGEPADAAVPTRATAGSTANRTPPTTDRCPEP